MFPLLPPPLHALKGGGKRESGAWTAHGHQIFTENLTGVAPLPGNARDRYSSPARPRSPSLQSLPAENLRIHWGLVQSYNEPSRLSGHRAHPLDRRVPPSSFANSVWQQAEARGRESLTDPTMPASARSIQRTQVTARGLCLEPRGTACSRGITRPGLHPQTLTSACPSQPATMNHTLTARRCTT